LFVQIDEVASRAEFVPALWWQHLLHNQTSLLIKGAPSKPPPGPRESSTRYSSLTIA
jgi:hypothetical protein